MVEPGSELAIEKQCNLLGVSRSTWYYQPVQCSGEEIIRQQILEIYDKRPFYGYRRISRALKRAGLAVGEYTVRRIMAELGITAIYPKPNLSKPNKEHQIYPYLLRNLPITSINQVWATDITYIRIPGGFMYLTAVMDLFSRKVLSWSLSNTFETRFCVEALEEALRNYGAPEIFNTDQGSQYTSHEFTSVLKNHGIEISMDGKGRALDNIFVERLWRTVKYEEIYLREYDSVKALRTALAGYFDFYNNDRIHQSLGYFCPSEIYEEGMKLKQAIAG